ncbi:hypothetical protein ACFXKC_53515 [Streptomyces sp. NPDC059340]|uniref:hypothetical protein n=1 Tax=Streptomyces sp. NPDC059340 TaxID=3346806 RepID=UPI0036D034C1
MDQALGGRGVPPGTVRVERLPGERMCIWLRWDVSRCVGPGGIRMLWGEETGWAYAYVVASARGAADVHDFEQRLSTGVFDVHGK